jgi:4-methyl-5(b-hydroxyethyl)-thiazole monophosphate biosynthesis
LFAPGFEEIETISIVDVLRRAEVEVVLAGTERGVLDGGHGIGVRADCDVRSVRVEDFDALVLPGGMPNARTLAADARCQELIRAARTADLVVAAICAAPIALAAAGVIGDAAFTSHPGVTAELPAANYREDRVVRDGKLVTSRGPGTAIEFALALVALLCGDEVAARLAAPMLVATP